MSTTNTTTKKAPAVSQTSQGYNYVRCQRGSRDDTVYIHQLCAIAAGADPYNVFADFYEVHHRVRVPTQFGDPQIDVPWNVELRPGAEHRSGHMNGDHDDLAADVPIDLGDPAQEAVAHD